MPDDRRPIANRNKRRRTAAELQPRPDILHAIDEAVFLINAEGVIVTWNQAAERIFGYSAREAIGSSLADVFPGGQVGDTKDELERVLQGETVSRLEGVQVRKDGEPVNTIVQAFPARDAARRVIGALVIVRDVTEYRHATTSLIQLERAAESRAQMLATANRVALDILSSHTGVEALHDIAEAAKTLTEAHHAVVTISRPDEQEEIRDLITAGLKPEEDVVLRRRLPALPVHALLLAGHGPMRINRPSEDPVLGGIPPIILPMESFLGLALQHGGTLHGTLFLVNKQGGGGFTEDDTSAVQTLAPYAAVAIRNMLMLSRMNALVNGLMAAQEEERQALAYDLHDGLTQFVMAAHMHMEAFRVAYAGGNRERADRELERGLGDLKKAVTESRRLVNGLRLLVLDDLGLAGALEQLLTEERTRAGWEDADLVHNIAERRFDQVLETAVYRVAQEALTNARKHARTSRVRLLMLEDKDDVTDDRCLRLEVADSGCGFVPDEKLAVEGRVGLHGMQERASLLGGTFHVASAPGEGTVIRATFPVRPLSPEQQAAIGEVP